MYHCSLEPAVRTVPERVADHGVAGAHDTGGQHEKIADVADLFVELVDGFAECQQWAHRVLPGCRSSARADGFNRHRSATTRRTREATAHLQKRLQRSVLPRNRFCRLDRAGQAQRLIQPSKHKSRRTISARHGAVNWKMGKLRRGVNS